MSQKYQVTAPDGSKFVVTAPEGATREQALRFAKQQFEQQQQTERVRRPQARPTPAPEMMAQEQAAPRERLQQFQQNDTIPMPGSVFSAGTIGQYVSPAEELVQTATAADVDPETSASARARLALGLTAPVAKTKEEKRDVVQRALGEDVEVRIGPDTGEIEWRKPSGQFALVNEPGLDAGDLVRALPETGVLLGGVGGGVGLGLLGGAASGGNPLITGTSTTAGVAGGEGISEYGRISAARALGYLPETTNDQAIVTALDRAKVAGALTAIGGVGSRAAARLFASKAGGSDELLEALDLVDDPEEALRISRQLQERTKEATGEDLPLTAGQAFDSPELASTEQLAAGSASPKISRPILEKQKAQSRVKQRLETQTFGDTVPPSEQKRILREISLGASREGREAQGRMAAREQAVTPDTPITPEQAAAAARRQIDIGVDEVFESFRPQFERIAGSGAKIDMTPVRETAETIRNSESQEILRSISLARQPLVSEAAGAGLSERQALELGSDNVLRWQTRLTSEPRSIGEVQRALRDIRRERRRPSVQEDRAKNRILGEIEASLEKARAEALDPEELSLIKNAEEEYAKAVGQYRKGFVDRFTATTREGLPEIESSQALEELLSNPDTATEFITSINNLPNNQQVLSSVRNSLVSQILRQSRNADGEITQASLSKYLKGRNRDALKALFEGDPIAGKLDSLRRAAEALQKRNKMVQNATSKINELTGQRTLNYQKLAQLAFGEGDTAGRINSADVLGARRLLPESEKKAFDSVFQQTVRDSLYENGTLSLDKLNSFINSRNFETAKEVLGSRFADNLTLLRDVYRKTRVPTEEEVGRNINGFMKTLFGPSVGAAVGMQRFLRVPFPPLSVSGRALTATLGQLQEKGQKQLAQALADPSKVNEMRTFLGSNIAGRARDKIMTRLGITAYLEAEELIDKYAGEIEYRPEQEQQGPQSVSPTL